MIMTKIEKYKRFLGEIGWDEFNNVEKQYLFEDLDGKGNDFEGILFDVRQNNTKDGYIVVEHKQTGAKLVIQQQELQDFLNWLEKTYTEGEDGASYFELKSKLEKREMPKVVYTYDLEQKVLSIMQEYFPPRRISKGVGFVGENGLYQADFAIFGTDRNIRVIIEVKSRLNVTESVYKKIYENLRSANYDGYFVLTDGDVTIYSRKGQSILEGNFRLFLKEIAKNDNTHAKPTLTAIKDFLKSSISKTEAKSKFEKEKEKLLKQFIENIHSGDIHQDEKEDSTWLLSITKERELFRILLGEYEGDYIVKFSSARSLLTLLEKESIGMCSLVCMNDPSEKDYADSYLGINDGVSDSADTFIISACGEDAETDLTMWRLYGDDAKGVCLKLWIDKEKINKHGFYLAPVSYSKPNKEHYELEVIKNITNQPKDQNWKIELSEWHIWKHFFKQHMYAVENEIRLLYMPSEYIPLSESIWFTDDRTSIYSEMKVFDLSRSTAFPLSLSRVVLGIKFPMPKENIPQFNRRFTKSGICIHQSEERDKKLVSLSDIENYR